MNANNLRSPKLFMPIPDAPNYAINIKRTVINLKTGKPVKLHYRANRGFWVASVFNEGKEIKRSVESFYRQALDAYTGTNVIWRAIPSLNCQYEISGGGDVRNAKTKKLIKEQREGHYVYVRVQVNGVSRIFPVKKLFTEVFGGDYRCKARSVHVQISKDDRQWHFPTIKSCVEFLTKKVFYCEKIIREKMQRREREVFGYTVRYY